MDIDLRGGKANARGVVHGFQHVADNDSQRIIDDMNVFRFCAKSLIGKMKNI